MMADFVRKQWIVLGVLALGAGAATCATTTLSYQVSSSADDGYAWSAAGQNLAAGYLLIGDGSVSAPYYMSAMRFNNVSVPRSAAIIDARLKIRSISEEYRGQIYGVIQAEADDDATDFSSRYIGSAVKTAAAVNWDHKFAWETNTQYTSGDISSIVQEVTDRAGWSSGNSAVVFYSTRTDSGKSRGFGSVDLGASYAAVLEVTYETYTISGHVTTSGGSGLSGVAVSAGVDIESAVTDGSGYYQLQVPPGWSGTVTVDKPDWGFVPVSQPYSTVTSDQTAQDYTAFQPVIFGHITEDGAGVEGVTVSADNGGGSDTTDSSGYYEITVSYDWSGTITAGKTGWLLIPSGHSYSNVIADQPNQDFTAFQPVISGHITQDGAGVAGVTVSADNGGGSDTTDAAGYYEIIVPYDWSGTVTVDKPGWGFDLFSRPYSNVASDQIDQNFTAFQPVISGHITEDGAGVAGVTVSADNGGGSDTTDPDGYYEIIVPYGWSGSVTSNRLGWDIEPVSYSYSIVTGDQDGQIFVATNTGIIVKQDGSGDFATIQAAIDAAIDGDIVYVSSGTYIGEGNREIEFGGKAITVRSISGDPNDCIIDCQGSSTNPHRGFRFTGGETNSSILNGFTIINGYAPKEEAYSNGSLYSCGGAVYCKGSSPTITNCRFIDNRAKRDGGAFGIYDSSPVIRNCTFMGNSVAIYVGGGIRIWRGSPTITDCKFIGNHANFGGE